MPTYAPTLIDRRRPGAPGELSERFCIRIGDAGLFEEDDQAVIAVGDARGGPSTGSCSAKAGFRLLRNDFALFPARNSNRNHLKGISYAWFHHLFREWVDSLCDTPVVAHQARHTLATNLLKNGADLTHVKRYLGQVSDAMAEHYVHIANTDRRLEDALNAI
ncbi:site-specific integrase [Streptomyces sp. NPDC018352]|uniref:site-specific integrase n=1 Tax=Streptomyces sp. NPDC018352 TaxID=3157194 RepID=UPI0034097A7E